MWIDELQVGMAVASLLNRKELGLRLQPDDFVAVFGTALFRPKFSGAKGDVFMGDHLSGGHILSRRVIR